jgi:hypothetical protein
LNLTKDHGDARFIGGVSPIMLLIPYANVAQDGEPMTMPTFTTAMRFI